MGTRWDAQGAGRNREALLLSPTLKSAEQIVEKLREAGDLRIEKESQRFEVARRVREEKEIVEDNAKKKQNTEEKDKRKREEKPEEDSESATDSTSSSTTSSEEGEPEKQEGQTIGRGTRKKCSC